VRVLSGLGVRAARAGAIGPAQNSAGGQTRGPRPRRPRHDTAIAPPEESAIAITIRDREPRMPAGPPAHDGAVYCPF
jgi:hypothetical protein